MTALRVLLITNRPSVHAFLQEHGARSIPTITATHVPLALDALPSHMRDLNDANVAMIDVGADPDAAVEVASELHRLRSDLRVLAVLCCPNPTMPWHVRSLLSNGVHEMLDAQTTPSELVERLNSAVHGQHAVRVALHRDYGASRAWSSEPLSADDQQLLELVAHGLSDVEIGLRLRVGERTVREHVRSLRDALQLRNREELAAWAGAHGYYRPTRPQHAPDSAGKVAATGR